MHYSGDIFLRDVGEAWSTGEPLLIVVFVIAVKNGAYFDHQLQCFGTTMHRSWDPSEGGTATL